jgi:hypothetical protein
MLVSMGRRLAPPVLLAALVLAGCGGSSSNGEAKKTAAQVVADAKKAALGASSVHVTGAGSDNGRPLKLDLTIGRKTAKGHLQESGASFDVIRVGDTVYVRGDDAFLKKFGGTAAATLFHGRWLKGPITDSQLGALAPLTDLQQFFGGVLGQHGVVENKGETTRKGAKVVEIRDTTQGGSLFVAATGDPYPVALAGGGQQGDVEFADWNADAEIAAPPNAVDLGALGK